MHIDLDESNDIVVTLREGTSGASEYWCLIPQQVANGIDS